MKTFYINFLYIKFEAYSCVHACVRFIQMCMIQSLKLKKSFWKLQLMLSETKSTFFIKHSTVEPSMQRKRVQKLEKTYFALSLNFYWNSSIYSIYLQFSIQSLRRTNGSLFCQLHVHSFIQSAEGKSKINNQNI